MHTLDFETIQIWSFKLWLLTRCVEVFLNEGKVSNIFLCCLRLQNTEIFRNIKNATFAHNVTAGMIFFRIENEFEY